jgi:hypothetical protein
MGRPEGDFRGGVEVARVSVVTGGSGRTIAKSIGPIPKVLMILKDRIMDECYVTPLEGKRIAIHQRLF